MTASHIIAIRCAPDERPVWTQALAELNTALQGRAVFSPTWLASVTDGADDAEIVCLSLLDDVFGGQSWPVLEAQWRSDAAVLRDGAMARGAPVFIATIFRHLPPEHAGLLHLLRRLNLLAAQLSQEFGLFVIDVDRVLAHRGALILGADARLGSQAARDLAAQTIVDTLLGAGIDHLVDDELLQSALRYRVAQREAAQDKLSVPVELLRLERSKVKAKAQIYATHRDLIDDRSLAGLLRDLRAGRIGVMAFGRQCLGKVAARLASL